MLTGVGPVPRTACEQLAVEREEPWPSLVRPPKIILRASSLPHLDDRPHNHRHGQRRDLTAAACPAWGLGWRDAREWRGWRDLEGLGEYERKWVVGGGGERMEELIGGIRGIQKEMGGGGCVGLNYQCGSFGTRSFHYF